MAACSAYVLCKDVTNSRSRVSGHSGVTLVMTNLFAFVLRSECDRVFDVHGIFHKFNEFFFLDSAITAGTEALEQFTKLFRSDLGYNFIICIIKLKI